MKQKILMFGKSGQLGTTIKSSIGNNHSIKLLDRSHCDLSNGRSIREVIKTTKPDIVINAAAYTQVDDCELKSDLAFCVNSEAPLIMAEETEKLGALFVHYSTDYVFDGKKQSPYTEKDIPNPINVYGKSKLKGEENIKKSTDKYFILRTSWVISPFKKNFLKTILNLASERKSLEIISDQRGAPTSTFVISQVTSSLIDLYSETSVPPSKFGTYHVTCSGSTNWNELARNIIEQSQKLNFQLKTDVENVLLITSSEYFQKATRPANSVLSCRKLQQQFGITMPSWREAVCDVLEHFERIK